MAAASLFAVASAAFVTTPLRPTIAPHAIRASPIYASDSPFAGVELDRDAIAFALESEEKIREVCA